MLKLILFEIPILLACGALAHFIYVAAQKEQWMIAGVLSLVFILVVTPKIHSFSITKEKISVNEDDEPKA